MQVCSTTETQTYKKRSESPKQKEKTMKDPKLESKLLEIEHTEQQRRLRVAKLLTRKRKQQSSSRKAAIQRMIKQAKWNAIQQAQERRRSTFGMETRRGALLHPLPQPELDIEA